MKWDDPNADPVGDIKEWVRKDADAWMFGPSRYAYDDGWYTMEELAAKLKAEHPPQGR